jgi:hypothetical protein
MTTFAAPLQLTDAASLENQLVSVLASHPYRVFGTRIWVSVQHSDFDAVAQGWKLHVSARPSTLLVTLEHALPVLLARRCSFKVTRSTDVLREMNSAGSSPGVVGKAVTVYPPKAKRETWPKSWPTPWLVSKGRASEVTENCAATALSTTDTAPSSLGSALRKTATLNQC